ncbi:MAG: POTRA domain-containing protein [Tatlockia sp.]|jgi:hemolysin activation/secretion protein
MHFLNQPGFKKIIHLFELTCCVLLSVVFFSPTVLAFSFEPGLIGKSISNTSAPSIPRAGPGLTQAPVEKPAINPEAAKITFELNRVEISGNTAFPTKELQALFKPWLHRTISVAQLQKLVQDITDKYQKAGYFLSKAILPPQEISNGAVKVTVIEGFISEIKVQGVTKPELIRFLEKFGKAITANRPAKLAYLEKKLLILNDTPGFGVKSVLAPDPAVPLGSTLTLVTEYDPVQVTLMQDNYQTRFLGPDETTLFAQSNSSIIPGGTLYARLLNANEQRNLQYYEMRHDQVLGTNGLILTLDSFVTLTHPKFVLTPLKIFGQSSDANVSLSYPLIRTKQRNLRIFGQFESMTNFSNALGEQLYIDRIRDVYFIAQYSDFLWKGEDFLNFTLDAGLNVLGAGGLGFRSRTGADPSFLKLVLTASRNQVINDHFSVYALVTAQHSNHILPAAETFFFGGPFIGRGYDWAQFTGDKGVAGKAELRLNTAPNWRFLKQVQYFGFYDSGKVWSLIDGIPPISGTSAGFGLRAMISKNINAEGFFGKPITTPNASQVLAGHSGHAFLGYFQVSAVLF